MFARYCGAPDPCPRTLQFNNSRDIQGHFGQAIVWSCHSAVMFFKHKSAIWKVIFLHFSRSTKFVNLRTALNSKICTFRQFLSVCWNFRHTLLILLKITVFQADVDEIWTEICGNSRKSSRFWKFYFMTISEISWILTDFWQTRARKEVRKLDKKCGLAWS